MNPDLSILTEAERLKFNIQQEQLVPQFRHQFPDPLAPKTVIIIPSLSMDPEILSKISGHIYYEERLLCLLLLLRMPRTHVIYVTSTPIDEEIVDYYLHLIPGVTSMHARKRLTLLSCFDSSNTGLTEKILRRPRLMKEIKNLVPPSHVAHISAFNVTPLEEQLSLKLGFPLYGCPSDLSKWGSKTGSREIFKNAGLLVPPGFEHIFSIEEIIKALTQLKAENTWVKKAVIKLNEGFSGDGNAIFKYEDDQIITAGHFKSQLKIVAGELDYTTFIHKLQQMGGIIEAFVECEIKTSPSVQCLINPLKAIEVVSTHDQILGGESGQVYIGATFPADAEYRKEIGLLGYKAAKYMASLGVLGRFGIDFVSVKEEGIW
ncbi:MAG: ATP-grasp domain-containing protein [Saprospiraceae bacterium]